MAVIKTRIKEKNYIQIEKEGIDDKRLSWAATGLLTYLIGRPENWNIIIKHLKTVKTNGRDSTRNALNNLREFNYCHYFEIREKGKIVETIYLVFEKPISPEEAEKEIEVSEGQKIYYKKFKSVKRVDNKEVQPKTENPFSATPTSVNTTLLIKEYTKERNTNNRTTTKDTKNDLEKDKKISSSYKFLDKNIFNLLNSVTKKNIRKNIKDLTEEKFSEEIPTMVNRLETTNDGLKLESLNKTLKNISNNSKEIYRMSKTISENSKWYNEKIVDTAEKQIYDTGKKARELIDEHSHFSFLIDKSILFIIITMFIINLAMVIFYKRQLNDITSEVNKVHNVLMDNKKYWIDESNYSIFIKQVKNQNN